MSTDPKVSTMENLAKQSQRPEALGASTITRAQLLSLAEASSSDKKNERLRKHKEMIERFGSLENKEDLQIETLVDVIDETDLNVLCFKILQNILLLVDGDRASMFLVDKEKQVLRSQIFDCQVGSNFDDVMIPEERKIELNKGVGIVGHVWEMMETEVINDCYNHPRFSQDVDKKTGFVTKCIMAAPVSTRSNECVAIAMVLNKRKEKEQMFTEKDRKQFDLYLKFCGIGIAKADMFRLTLQERQKNLSLIDLAKKIFFAATDMEKLSNIALAQLKTGIAVETTILLVCKVRNTSVFQRKSENSNFSVDEEIFDEINLDEIEYHCIYEYTDTLNNMLKMNNESTCFYKAVADSVIKSREIISLYDKNSRQFQAFKQLYPNRCGSVSSLLAIPIYKYEMNEFNVLEAAKVIGVTILLNKIVPEWALQSGQFTESDEDQLSTFNLFIGVGVHNTCLYQRAFHLMVKQHVALEVLSYHASADTETHFELVQEPIHHPLDFQLYSFSFNDTEWSSKELVKMCVSMFYSLSLPKDFGIAHDVLCRWVLTVRKNYRPVTYHNWRHGFNVCQTVFGLLTTGDLIRFMKPESVLSLLMATLCHDLDHRGTNNSFQKQGNTALGSLYTTSTLEQHHFNQTVMVLNTEGNNILENVDDTQYCMIMSEIEHAILSTDLALFFQKKSLFEELTKEKHPEWKENAQNNAVLRAMMMTACDLSAIAKPWELQREVAIYVYEEFFEQGDAEAKMFGNASGAMFDRGNLINLPKMQVGFIKFICLPLYTMFEKCFPKTKPLADGCRENEANWNNEQSLVDRGTPSEFMQERIKHHHNSRETDEKAENL